MYVCTVHKGNKLSKLAEKVQFCIYPWEEKNFRTTMFRHIDCVSSSVDMALTTQHKCNKDPKGLYI